MKREKSSLRAAWELQMDGGLQGEGCIPWASAGEPEDCVGQTSYTLQLSIGLGTLVKTHLTSGFKDKMLLSLLGDNWQKHCINGAWNDEFP